MAFHNVWGSDTEGPIQACDFCGTHVHSIKEMQEHKCPLFTQSSLRNTPSLLDCPLGSEKPEPEDERPEFPWRLLFLTLLVILGLVVLGVNFL